MDEALQAAKALLADFDKNLTVVELALKCQHLGRLLDDQFILSYVENVLRGAPADVKPLIDRLRKERPTDANSGIVQFLEDFKLSGPPVTRFLVSGGQAEFLKYTLPAAQTFASTARKRVKYTLGQEGFIESIEQAERVIDRVRGRLHRYTSTTYLRLRFGSIPETILEATRRKVDHILASKCPSAVEGFAVAYEQLQGTSPENWSNACLGVRRILVEFADAVFPPRSEPMDGHDLGRENYINRIWAYASERLKSDRGATLLLAELTDLGNRVDSIHDLANKGVHARVTKDEADRVVIRAYLLLADILSV